GVGNRLAVALEHRTLEPVHARAQDQALGREPEPVAGAFPARALALPEPEVEMVLVRALGAGAAGVAVQAHDRAPDARIGVDARGEAIEFGSERLDEVAGGLEQERVVLLPVRLEPRPIVVLAEEAKRLRREALEAAH